MKYILLSMSLFALQADILAAENSDAIKQSKAQLKLTKEQQTLIKQQAVWMAERKKKMAQKIDRAIDGLPIVSLEEL